jgi:hypothetical protein
MVGENRLYFYRIMVLMCGDTWRRVEEIRLQVLFIPNRIVVELRRLQGLNPIH